MIGKTVSHYEVLSKIGAGGMGDVYKAHDITLKRKVALKFLPPELMRDEEARKRFIREAQAAAALDHPNICTVYEVGQSEGHAFIAMQLVEGQSLRERIQSGPLPVDEAMKWALQIGRGLSKAHGSGIVHRDIKPGNVLLTEDGVAKVVDFGLAKLGEHTKLTRTGTTLGTVAYMSPEQARGDEVDHRADVWALGAVLYEMLTSQMPFRGDYEPAIVYSILNEHPEPITAARREVSVSLEDVVERALAKDPAKRYQSVDEMIAALEMVQEESRLGIERRGRAAYKRITRRKRLVVGLAAVVVIAIAVVLVTSLFESSQALDSIAVMPLENLSGDEEQDILADGIAAKLITHFDRIEAFEKVISRMASMRYKGTDKSPREIAQELGVKVMVGGIIQIEGDNIRITAELIKGETAERIWSDTFTGPKRDILRIQGQIAQAIADEINLEITPEERELLTIKRQVDWDAWVAYLKGNDYSYIGYYWRQKKAAEWYEKAIKIDSTYAPAYARLSRIHSLSLLEYEVAESLATRALELDPKLPEAYLALYHARLARDWDFDGAEHYATKAEQLLTSRSTSPMLRNYYMHTGQWDKAIDVCRREVAADPLNWERLDMLTFFFIVASRPDEALETGRKILERFPDDEKAVKQGWEYIAEAYTMMGLADSAFAIAHREEIEVPLEAYPAAGMHDTIRVKLEKLLNAWEQRDGPRWGEGAGASWADVEYRIGRGYALLGDNDKAFEFFERAYEGHAWWMLYLNNLVGAGGLDNLLEDPRLADLMRRIGFPRTNIEQRLASIEKYKLQRRSK